MIMPPSDRHRLFVLVRSHAQIQHWLKVGDARRAANQGGLSIAIVPGDSNVTEIHPLPTLRRRG
jgi:hypothetical protein